MPTSLNRNHLLNWGWILPLVAFVAACQPAADRPAPPDTDPTNTTTKVNDSSRVPANGDPADLEADPNLVADRWAAITQQGQKIGFMRETIRRNEGQNGQAATIRTTSIQEFQIKRLEQTITTRVENIFLETETGQLLEYASKMSQGGASMLFRGKRVSTEGDLAQFEITTSQPGQESAQTERLTWPTKVGGMHAQRLALEDPPIGPGETRDRQILQPLVNRPANITFNAAKPEPVRMIGGTEVTLLRIDQRVELDGQGGVPTTMWVDDLGVVVKMSLQEQQLEIISCDREFAMGPNQPVTFDLATETIVPVTGDIGSLRTAQAATYHLRHTSGDLTEMLSGKANQSLHRRDDGVALLTVHRIDPQRALPPDIDRDDPPAEADLEPSSLIQSDDTEVLKLAATLPEGAAAWETALAAERLVHETVTEKNFSQGFASAADVARMREGDCTEHSVLLMAILRAKGIPARGAIGLVYHESPQAKGFAYHMWTEAWIDDRWIPLDATRPPGPIGVDYIKVTQSSLEGSAAFSAFLPVSRIIGQVEILGVKAE